MTDNNPNGDHEVTDLMEQPKADDSISDTITQAIKMAYPLEQQQLLVVATQWPLNYLVPNLISDEELSEIVTALDPLTVGQFFCSLGLSETDGGRDLAIWSEDIEDDASPHQTIGVLIFDEITNEIEETNTLMESVSAILLEDKDSIINNYVVPNYKIPKGDFDAEDPFETALSRGLRDLLGGPVGSTIFCYLRYDLALFDDSDFVSCFEYVLEATIEDEVDFQPSIPEEWIHHFDMTPSEAFTSLREHLDAIYHEELRFFRAKSLEALNLALESTSLFAFRHIIDTINDAVESLIHYVIENDGLEVPIPLDDCPSLRGEMRTQSENFTHLVRETKEFIEDGSAIQNLSRDEVVDLIIDWSGYSVPQRDFDLREWFSEVVWNYLDDQLGYHFGDSLESMEIFNLHYDGLIFDEDVSDSVRVFEALSN